MSISLRKEQGFYFMQQADLKTPTSAQKRFECWFQGNVWRQECPSHLERNKVFISCNEQAKKRRFQLKKGLNVYFKVTRDGKNVHLT